MNYNFLINSPQGYCLVLTYSLVCIYMKEVNLCAFCMHVLKRSSGCALSQPSPSSQSVFLLVHKIFLQSLIILAKQANHIVICPIGRPVEISFLSPLFLPSAPFSATGPPHGMEAKCHHCVLVERSLGLLSENFV